MLGFTPSLEYFMAPLAPAVSPAPVTLNPDPSSPVWIPFIFFNLSFKTSLQEQPLF